MNLFTTFRTPSKWPFLNLPHNFFEDLSKGKGPKNSILALGYAGWGPGQIEKEILANSWMTLSTDSQFLFDEEVSNKWNKAYNLLGIDPNKLSQFSGRA